MIVKLLTPVYNVDVRLFKDALVISQIEEGLHGMAYRFTVGYFFNFSSFEQITSPI